MRFLHPKSQFVIVKFHKPRVENFFFNRKSFKIKFFVLDHSWLYTAKYDTSLINESVNHIVWKREKDIRIFMTNCYRSDNITFADRVPEFGSRNFAPSIRCDSFTRYQKNFHIPLSDVCFFLFLIFLCLEHVNRSKLNSVKEFFSRCVFVCFHGDDFLVFLFFFGKLRISFFFFFFFLHNVILALIFFLF